MVIHSPLNMKERRLTGPALMFLLGLCLPCGYTAAQSMILTSDQQLRDIATDPDKQVDISIGSNKRKYSLRELCETKKRNGSGELNVFFDEFFKQYRPEERGAVRELTPDMDEYVELIKKVSDFAAKYDIGLGLSLLSPLELGKAYQNRTGKSGRWLAYKVGLRNPRTGTFSLNMWQHTAWVNNKGRTPVTLKDVKAYAFRDKKLGVSPYRAVNPEDIYQISDVGYEVLESVSWSIPMNYLRIYGESTEYQGYDKVLVILEYETPEMDYFDDSAPVFLKELLDRYHTGGVNLVSLYSDEMHIQQDWYYTDHHESGQFNHRYLTHSFSEKYRERYGLEFEDKHMLYFVYGPQTYGSTIFSALNEQYVMGETPEEVHRTFLLRDSYYRMLNDGVVDLFREAKTYAEKIFDRELPTEAHASWAQSPTLDFWNYEKRNGHRNQYEYTSNFLWGNTVHQASAACYDYFKWSEYLEPTGNDFAEGGWNDRNYYGAAMAASIGVINRKEKAYAEAWGMPAESRLRRTAINRAYGAELRARNDIITGDVHRDTEVLILYPMNLVAFEERFGSWVTQYGYANYLTGDKLLEMGELLPDGKIRVAKKTYSTLVTLFEPLPDTGMLDLMERFAGTGGRVLWCGPPPLIDKSGVNCREQWERIMGVRHHTDIFMGEMAPGRTVDFRGSFDRVPSQTILTDYLVDRLYPVIPTQEVEIVATSEGRVVGTVRKYPGGGVAAYCGFRPRDDQSRSLGYETRTLFEILDAIGAYPPTGIFPGVNDNPSYLSRTTDYFVSAFPNGSTMVVRHYRTHPETWEGGFSRDPDADARALAANPMPDSRISLIDAKINGHSITYDGDLSLGFRTDISGRLTAFDGADCREIEIDGILYEFSTERVNLKFGPGHDDPSCYCIYSDSGNPLRIPVPQGTRTATIKAREGTDSIQVDISDGWAAFTLPSPYRSLWVELELK